MTDLMARLGVLQKALLLLRLLAFGLAAFQELVKLAFLSTEHKEWCSSF